MNFDIRSDNFLLPGAIRCECCGGWRLECSGPMEFVASSASQLLGASYGISVQTMIFN